MRLSCLALIPGLAASLAIAACGGAAPQSVGVIEHGSKNLVELNGKKMNGPQLNGKKMNGTSLDGLDIASVSLASATVGGVAVTGVTLAKSSFSGTSGHSTINGTKFAGVSFTATLSNGSTVPLTIASAAQLPSPNADVIGYAVTYESATGAQPLCGLEADGSLVMAVPVAGTFNPAAGVSGGGSYTTSSTIFTFACRHFAVEKCIEFGYAPWKSQSGSYLQNAWVACTRMLRADYCGDGTPHTVDGTLIDVFDRYGIQTDAALLWPVEAEWSSSGAVCMTAGVTDRYVNAGLPAPTCYSAKVKAVCGTFLSSSTLLIDRYNY